MAWTKDQEKAIHIRGSNVIVSAGAGSGKTAVLTERACQMITNQETAVSSLLILTFTNAAAFEMKDRIRSTLRKQKQFALADEVEASDITTFDAYALSIVKKYHWYFDLPSNISILDGSILDMKAGEILDEMFAARYESGDAAFLSMIDHFCVKNDRDLRAFVKKMVEESDLKKDSDAFLRNYFSTYCSEKTFQNWMGQLLCSFKEKLERIKDSLDFLEHPSLRDALEQRWNQLLEAKNYNDFYLCVNSFPRLPIYRDLSDEDKDMKNRMMDIYKENVKNYVLELGDEATIRTRFEEAKGREALSILLSLAMELKEKLLQFEREMHSFTFAEIAKMALQLVETKQIREELRSSIRFIMVDEYQDTSDIQEAFVQALANDNVFMVGDTKQSIYAFRNANCAIFQDKYLAYATHQGGEKIDLDFNFRSRREVIDDFNRMFSRLMKVSHGGVDYQKDHIAHFGNQKYEDIGNVPPSHNLELLSYELDGNSAEKYEYEARIIAEDIVKKVNEEYMVYSPKEENPRPIKFSDFAILTANKSQFDVYRRVFDEYQIPLKTFKDETLMGSEVGIFFQSLVFCLASLFENQFDASFLHYYASLARSFVVQMSDEELFYQIKEKKYAQSELFLKLQSISQKQMDLSLVDYLSYALEQFDIYEKLYLLPNIKNNHLTLEHFFTYAKQLSELGYSLPEFASYLKNMKMRSIDIQVESKEQVGNVVSMMSIHKSKGLEFGVIYYPMLSGKISSRGDSSRFSAHHEYGFLLPDLYDGGMTLSSYLAKEYTKQENLSERIRLFYVSLTRAREKMILLADESKLKPVYFPEEMKSYLDFLLYAETYGYSYEKRKVTLEYPMLQKKQEETMQIPQFLLKEIPQVTLSKEKKRASKTEITADASSVQFGEKLHYDLEICDLVSKDVSFIEDETERRIIKKVLQLDLFANLKKEEVYQEYHFYREETEEVSIIDLFLLKENEIILVDYKTKDIDDPAYIEQIAIYRDYLKKTFHRPVKAYLLSLLLATYREVKE